MMETRYDWKDNNNKDAFMKALFRCGWTCTFIDEAEIHAEKAMDNTILCSLYVTTNYPYDDLIEAYMGSDADKSALSLYRQTGLGRYTDFLKSEQENKKQLLQLIYTMEEELQILYMDNRK